MPNTLAHFGGQGPLTRLTGVSVDTKWILLGCTLPDVPWIARRGIQMLAGGAVDPIGLRLYAIVQASLFFSVMLAGILALLAARPRPVFAVLALGSTLHLLLDAAQTKWGNGVHFFAPVSWTTVNFGWFWPEAPVTIGLAVAGLAYVGWEWKRRTKNRIPVSPDRVRGGAAIVLTILYLSLPPIFFPEVLSSGSHSLRALAEPGEQIGRSVALDRAGFRPAKAGTGGEGVLTVTGGALRAVGSLPEEAGKVSVRGVLLDGRTIRVTRHHAHSFPREAFSVVGLVLVAVVWFRDWSRTAPERDGDSR